MNKNKIFFIVFSMLFSSFVCSETVTITATDNADTARWVKIMFNLGEDRKLINYEPSGYKAREVQVKTVSPNVQFSRAEIVYPEFEGQKGICKQEITYYGNKYVYSNLTTICRDYLSFELTQ